MSGETWTEVSSVSENWTDVEDSLNGYVVAEYVVSRYVSGTSGVVWTSTDDAETVWA